MIVLIVIHNIWQLISITVADFSNGVLIKHDKIMVKKFINDAFM